MSTLARWQLAIALLVLLLIATAGGFYTYARYRAQKALRDLPGKLAANIAQKALGFTYSKSQAGRTLFTIKATEMVQFKDGVHAELHQVTILVYGRQGDRYDQIYGNKFSYNQNTQEVRADGPVSIDLEVDPHPPPNANTNGPSGQVHLNTSGLVFSQATGIAQTAEQIEFRTPQGEGTAVGVIYDTHSGAVHLLHDVRLTAYSASSPQTITAASAVFSQSQSSSDARLRTAQLEAVTIRDSGREIKAPQLNIFLHPDNTLDHMTAEHGISSHSLTGPQNSISADSAVFLAEQNNGTKANQITRADLRGNVHLVNERTTADSGAATLHLTGRSLLQTIDLSGGTILRQPDGSELQTHALHIDFRPAHNPSLARATTSSPATITLLQPAARTTTVISASRMDASFDDTSHIQSLHAAPNVKVISTSNGKTLGAPSSDTGAAGERAAVAGAVSEGGNHTPSLIPNPSSLIPVPQRTTTSASLDATFTTTANQSALSHIVESGNVVITEGARTATADRADYDPRTQRAVLIGTPTGPPRLADNTTGMSISAKRIAIDSTNNHASAEGDIRVTYLPIHNPTSNPIEDKTQPSAAEGVFSGSGPTHAIASSAALSQSKDGNAILILTGSPARLWQGANILEAPQITFDRDRRSLTGAGNAKFPVTTSFVQQQKGNSGKLVPVTVTAQSLHYSDQGRRADFSHNVLVRGEDSTISAQQVSVLLYPTQKLPSASPSQPALASPGTIDQIVASGNIQLEQPGRHATGQRLTYNSQDARFVLTGTSNSPPSIFDAEHGSVTGDSLTFYSRDDRVLVESRGKRTITHTKLISAN